MEPLDLQDKMNVEGGVDFIDLKYLQDPERCIQTNRSDLAVLYLCGRFVSLVAEGGDVYKGAVPLIRTILAVGEGVADNLRAGLSIMFWI